jgi:hypothetical protein
MDDTIEKRISDLEQNVERFLGQLPGAPLSARVHALERRIQEGRITSATQIAEIAKIEANIDEILQRLPNSASSIGKSTLARLGFPVTTPILDRARIGGK